MEEVIIAVVVSVLFLNGTHQERNYDVTFKADSWPSRSRCPLAQLGAQSKAAEEILKENPDAKVSQMTSLCVTSTASADGD